MPMKRIVFSDVDGTLLDSGHRIGSYTARAIAGLRERGVPFVIVSARGPSGIYPIFHRYGFRAPIISYSGALVLDEEGRMLFHRGMPKDKAGEIIGYIEGERLDLSCCIYSYDQWIVKSRDDGRIRREEEMVEAEAEEGTLDSVAADEVSKILCICGSGEAENIERRLRGRFPDVSIVRSSDHLVEIMGKGVSKAASAALLCREYGLGMEDAIAFGDSYNDEELLRAAGKGFLMGNAPEDLKARISLHADDNDHEGIYRALHSLGLA